MKVNKCLNIYLYKSKENYLFTLVYDAKENKTTKQHSNTAIHLCHSY